MDSKPIAMTRRRKLCSHACKSPPRLLRTPSREPRPQILHLHKPSEGQLMGITTTFSQHDTELPNLTAWLLDSSKRKLSRCWWRFKCYRDLEIIVSFRDGLSSLTLLLADGMNVKPEP